MDPLNKYYSATTKLFSKAQLKEFRIQRWESLLRQEGLDLRLLYWWTDNQKALERNLWIEADQGYETRKAELNAALQKLIKAKREVYFKEVGLPADTDVNVYLAPSPAEIA